MQELLVSRFGAWPDGHSVQLDEPDIIATRPSGHCKHSSAELEPSNALDFPGAHKLHTVFESPPTALEYFPIPQFSQVVSFVAPGLVLYFPATHEWHPVDSL